MNENKNYINYFIACTKNETRKDEPIQRTCFTKDA